ncbi:hypothetical protein F5X68DRAFT_237520 [Plectosphaerella plurivora]|uniref:Oxidase ustYa n=1 Tax=Plectosphaerella plurivora TaxID=936078 RepID=A0A9P9A630_9PEZI|nr:hypothetical protein F5X68DRAFT_237520 [Plectosphaerella plurivora]
MRRTDSPYREDASRMSAEDDNDREKLLAGLNWQTGHSRADDSMTMAPRERGLAAFFSGWRWLLDTALLLIILGLLLDRRTGQQNCNVQNIGSDITGFAPKFTTQITKFAPTTAYIPENMTEFFFNESIKQAWLDLVPKGLGYIDIERLSPEDKAGLHDLPTPITGFPSNQTIFTTSVTHQLHCLYSITHSFAAAKTGIKAGGHQHGHRRRDEQDDLQEALIDEEFHVQHCFEYLRQSIMCSGDVAIEGDQTTFPEGSGVGSDGWDAKHVCRDWKQIYKHLEDTRANDEVWIA